MTPRRLAGLAFVLAVLVVRPASLAAQTAGTVAGWVLARVDTGAPGPAAGAVASIGGVRATTDAAGRFLLAPVTAGAHTLRVRLAGHRPLARELRVGAGDTLRLELVLEPETQLLAAVRVDARAAEAEAFATRPGVATLSVSASAMAGVPSVGEPDVVRVVQLLPGVVQRNDFNTGLDVRGGEADQNLVLLDGFPVYNPFHLGGLFSTFMDATVGGIELLTGAFPARYGGRLSSVLDVRSAEETRPGMHATVDVSALAATGRVSGTFGAERGGWSMAARRTYADAMTRVFTRDIFPYHFRDMHGRATYRLPGGARLAVTAYLGRDALDADLAEFSSDSAPTRAGEGRWAFEWGNHLIGTSLAKDVGRPRGRLLGALLGDSATFEQRLSTSGFSTRLDLGGGAAGQRSEVRDVRLAGSIVARGAAHERTIGYELATHRLRYASLSTQTGAVDFDLVQRPTTGALYAEDLWRLSPRWLVQAGLRAEALRPRDWAALSPRAAVKFFATPTFALTAAAGRITQPMHSLAGDGALRYFDIWLASDEHLPVSTAWHYVAGAERRAGFGSLRVEGYVKRYDRVLEANWSEDPGRRGDEFLTATGVSYGADAIARWTRRNGAAGWIAYTYGVSVRERDGMRWAPGSDRRHDLDAVVTWPLARYRIGARFGFATGTPYTPIVGQIARRVYDPSRDTWGTGEPRIWVESLGGARNAARFPPTHRLDLDVSREYRVRGAKVAPYVSVANAYNAQNVFVYLYEYSNDHPTRRAISQFPILPSLGVRVAF